MAAKIKKGDRVVVLAGKDKGKVGEVIQVMPKASRVIVSGVNMVKRHTAPSQVNAGGIVEKEAALHVSNVAHADPKDGKPTRVGFRVIEGDRKVRYAKRSGEVIDS
jgi:large subunit ribosomal protein L24